MSLDDKLREVLVTGYADFDEDGEVTYNSLVAQIKQVFAEAGYVTPENALKVQEMVNQMAQLAQDSFHMPTMVNVAIDKKQQKLQNLMTGQEWYDRFEKELRMGARPGYAYSQSGMLRAAKRAANLAEDTN